MHLARALHVAVAALLFAACGGDDDDGGTGKQPEGVDYPACPNPGELVLVGDLDGRDVVVTKQYTGLGFVNALAGMGSLEVDFADGEKVLVDFAELINDGEETDARGSVTLMVDGVVAGNCETDTTRTGRFSVGEDDDTYYFVLRDLKAAPFCEGAAISGELRGCVQSNSF